LLYSKGCRHVQVDEPYLADIGESVGASEFIGKMKKMAACFEVSYSIYVA